MAMSMYKVAVATAKERMSSWLHHMEVGVVDGPRSVKKLRDQFTFEIIGYRESPVVKQWLMDKCDTLYLITELKTDDKDMIMADDYATDWMDKCGTVKENNVRMDSAYNICLQVKNIERFLSRLEEMGVKPVKPLTTFSDSHGSVKTCTIKSIVGDIYHTLVEKENYTGAFLPGFHSVPDDYDQMSDPNALFEMGCKTTKAANTKDSQSELTQDMAGWTVDHVAVAVERGMAEEVVTWYEKCFGMHMFNRGENKIMGYWQWMTTRLTMPGLNVNRGQEFTLIIGDNLEPDEGDENETLTERWVRQHGGAGIFHIALMTGDVKAVVRNMTARGVVFDCRKPREYYLERKDAIDRAKQDMDELDDLGIQFDSEGERFEGVGEDAQSCGEKYLMQVFTKPIFPNSPFFWEFLQREGAKDFGWGNRDLRSEAFYLRFNEYF